MSMHNSLLITIVIFARLAESKDCPEPKYNYFCAQTNECQSNSEPCNGECPAGKRYCPQHGVICSKPCFWPFSKKRVFISLFAQEIVNILSMI